MCRPHQVSQLEQSGSAVSGEFHAASSEPDFLVEFQPLEPGPRADAYFGLLHGLEDLFGRPIDLVPAQAIRNPWFQRAVDRQRTVLYGVEDPFRRSEAEDHASPCT